MLRADPLVHWVAPCNADSAAHIALRRRWALGAPPLMVPVARLRPHSSHIELGLFSARSVLISSVLRLRSRTTAAEVDEDAPAESMPAAAQ